MWESDGADYPFAVVPDDNDPLVIRQRRIEYLVLLDNLQAHLPEIVEILVSSQNMHDASTRIAPLLGIDDEEGVRRLDNINLFAMTRTPSESRTTEFSELRLQP